MTLITCEECGKELNENAVGACPHCGFDHMQKNSSKKNCIRWLFLISTFIILGLLLLNSAFKKTKEHVVGSDLINAANFCQLVVEKELESPHSAQYPPIDTKRMVNHDGGDVYTVRSYVDTQSIYNGKIRMDYTCRTKRDKDGYFSLVIFKFQE